LTKGPIDEIEQFAYLGSVLSIRGGTEQDVEARVGKARTVLGAMDNLWKSKTIGWATKIRIFNCNM